MSLVTIPATPARSVGALLTGAAIWGVIWYPYRVLAEWGINGVAATALTYLIALLLAFAIFWRRLPRFWPSGRLLAIALVAGGCNIGYVLATLHGDVMRVLLLFYLAPLWTILLSRFLLSERLTVIGLAVIVLSLAGAATMLWHPQLGAPWPKNGAEWIGMLAGFLFALSNVLIRRVEEMSIELKSTAVFSGAVMIGVVMLALGWADWPTLAPAAPRAELLLVLGLVGVVLLVINLVVQYGLMHTPANRAIVILLSELVFAAFAAWWLAGEAMGAREWIGGAMIAGASLLSAKMEGAVKPSLPEGARTQAG
jgi:drug/metabolite transporter (DMT)-like permease